MPSRSALASAATGGCKAKDLGALPQAPHRELFEKSSLCTLKSFRELGWQQRFWPAKKEARTNSGFLLLFPSHESLWEVSEPFLQKGFRAGFGTASQGLVFYSLRSASTGSFLAAMRDGMRPEMRVSVMLMTTSAAPATGGTTATRVSRLVRLWMMALIG